MSRYRVTITLIIIAPSHESVARRVADMLKDHVGQYDAKYFEMDREAIRDEITAYAIKRGIDQEDIGDDWLDLLIDMLVDAST